MARHTGWGIAMSGFPEARFIRSLRPSIASRTATLWLMGMASTHGLTLLLSVDGIFASLRYDPRFAGGLTGDGVIFFEMIYKISLKYLSNDF